MLPFILCQDLQIPIKSASAYSDTPAVEGEEREGGVAQQEVGERDLVEGEKGVTTDVEGAEGKIDRLRRSVQ
jgi:hypothetical protein